jgi:hypothetical protein
VDELYADILLRVFNAPARQRLNERYISRIIPLAFLAPDITEAILEGRQPTHMTLETLRDDTPADWALQRKQLLRPIGLR